VVDKLLCMESFGVSPLHITEYLESLCVHCNHRTICRKGEYSNFGDNPQFNSFSWSYNFSFLWAALTGFVIILCIVLALVI